MFDLGLSSRTDILIRPSTREDVEGIARVSLDTWRGTYGGLLPQDVLDRLSFESLERRHARFLGEARTQHFVAVEPLTQEVVAFSNGGPNRRPRLGFDGEIYELYVQQGFQRRGLGADLFRTVSEGLAKYIGKSLIIWVLASNPNRGFYEAQGGRVVARQPVRMNGILMQEVAYGWGGDASTPPP